jgi:hypothetical protein
MAAQSLWSEFRARIRTLRGWRKVARMPGQPHPWNRTRGARQGRPLSGPAAMSERAPARAIRAGVERGPAALARNFAETLRVWLSNAPPSHVLLHRC